MKLEEKIKQHLMENADNLQISKNAKIWVSKLGMGKSNLNYLVTADKTKFVFRFSIDQNKEKSKREFMALKSVESLGISPKVRMLDTSRKFFDMDLIVLDYLEGKSCAGKKLDNQFIKQLAGMSAKMHLIDTKSLKNLLSHEECSYFSYLNVIKSYIFDIKKYIKNNQFLGLLQETFEKLKSNLPKQEKVKLVLTHGDICEQNIISNKGEYKFIDFEDLGLTDSAAEITHIFVDFGKPFNEEQKKIFLEEYFKLTGNDLTERVKSYIPLKIYVVFLWAVSHTLRVLNKKMHKQYLRSNDVKKDIRYAELVFKRAIDSGVINKKYAKLKLKDILR